VFVVGVVMVAFELLMFVSSSNESKLGRGEGTWSGMTLLMGVAIILMVRVFCLRAHLLL